MLRCLFFSLVLSVLAGPTAVAQPGRRFFDESDYSRLGLEQAWSTHVRIDSARARVGSFVLQVVGVDSYEQLQESVYRVFEVTYDGHTIRISENDVDSSGQVIGRDEAQRLAEKQIILLEAHGHKPALTTRDVPPTTVYVQSDSGTLHAMDAETGKTLWAVTIGNPRWSMVAPAANDRYVATVNGSTLYLLDRATGEPIWDRALDMNPATALSMSDRYVFVPGVSGRIEAYRLPTEENDHHGAPPWVYQSGGRVPAALMVGSTTVSWATEQGQMLVASLDGPQMIFRRQTGGPIYGQPVFLAPDRIVVASTDGYVTAVSERDGALQWDFSTGFDLHQTPIAQEDNTYAVTRRNELFCITSSDGTEKWVARGVEQVLACGKQRLYVRGANGTLRALNKETGARVASLAAPAYRVAYSNRLTDRIYMLTTGGTLLCLRERDAYIPTIYRPLPVPETTGSPDERRPSSSSDSLDTPDARPGDDDDLGADMFGADVDADVQPGEPDVEQPAGDDPTDDEEPADSGSSDEDDFDDPFDFG